MPHLDENHIQTDTSMLIALTGTTGYVGGRLLPLLEEQGYRVQCLVRRPEAMVGRTRDKTEIIRADLFDKSSLDEALRGVDIAFYLVHNMGASGDFEERDRRCAENFGTAAAACGVQRIIYLGGLGDSSNHLSKHLQSRQEVGEILRASGVPVIEFRASIIIGSGSLSFELIRALVERLPIMICPRWVTVPAQPIAIEDVLDYLKAAIELNADGNHIFEIGGPDQVSYGDIMQTYARQRGLKRWLIRVPVLTPRLSSLWLGLVTPIYARVGRKLIEGMRNPTLVRDRSAASAFAIRPRGIAEAIERAIIHEDRQFARTKWFEAYSAGGFEQGWGGKRFGNRIVDSRVAEVELPPEAAFAPIQRIGGNTGWYYGQWLWKIRGWMDLLVGGVGLRRG